MTTPAGDRPVVESVPRSVRLTAAWSWRFLVIVAALAVLVVVLAYAKILWVPVVVALLLTVLLAPVFDALVVRARLPRGLAAAVCLLGLVAVVGGLLTLAGRQIVQGFADLWDRAVAGFDEALVLLEESPLAIDAEEIDGYLTQVQDQLSANSGTIVSGAVAVTTTVGHVLAGAVIALFCLLFFLKDGPLIWAWLLRLLPSGGRQHAWEASRRGFVTLSSYVRAQILVAFVDAVGIGIGAAVLGLPLVIPLMVLIFLASFIPFVGAIATGAIAVLVALVDQGLGTALWMLAIVLLVQQIEGNVLQPFLLGHAVSLHPVAVVLAVTAGSITAGIIGALLAVPVAATLNTVVLYLHGRDKFPQLGRAPDVLEARLAAIGGHAPASGTGQRTAADRVQHARAMVEARRRARRGSRRGGDGT